jgi:uncharacterized YccA/Bax inhibitor family protein
MKIAQFLAREPVLVKAITGALLALLCAFGLKLSAEQVAVVTAAFNAFMGPLVRASVTPNA